MGAKIRTDILPEIRQGARPIIILLSYLHCSPRAFFLSLLLVHSSPIQIFHFFSQSFEIVSKRNGTSFLTKLVSFKKGIKLRKSYLKEKRKRGQSRETVRTRCIFFFFLAPARWVAPPPSLPPPTPTVRFMGCKEMGRRGQQGCFFLLVSTLTIHPTSSFLTCFCFSACLSYLSPVFLFFSFLPPFSLSFFLASAPVCPSAGNEMCGSFPSLPPPFLLLIQF